VEARLGDHRLARGHVGQELVGALHVDGEVGQVAVVDADDLRVEDLQRGLELLLVVHLDEDVEVEVHGLAVQPASCSGSTAATMSRIASAPKAADS
jgi:hypothetical protein